MERLTLSERFMYYSGLITAMEGPQAIEDLKHIAGLIEAEEQERLYCFPCKVGQVVAVLLFTPIRGSVHIEQAEVKEINVGKYNLRDDVQIKVERLAMRGTNYKYYLSEWGKNIFATLAEAERAIEEGRKNGTINN